MTSQSNLDLTKSYGEHFPYIFYPLKSVFNDFFRIEIFPYKTGLIRLAVGCRAKLHKSNTLVSYREFIISSLISINQPLFWLLLTYMTYRAQCWGPFTSDCIETFKLQRNITSVHVKWPITVRLESTRRINELQSRQIDWSYLTFVRPLTFSGGCKTASHYS